jgi:hypothetical protein
MAEPAIVQARAQRCRSTRCRSRYRWPCCMKACCYRKQGSGTAAVSAVIPSREHPALCSRLTVGWVERKAKPVITLAANDELSEALRPGRQLFLDRPPPSAADRSYRGAARGISICAKSISVHGRRPRRATGPPAHHLDFAQGGVGFCAPLAACQSELLAKPAPIGAGIT